MKDKTNFHTNQAKLINYNDQCDNYFFFNNTFNMQSFGIIGLHNANAFTYKLHARDNGLINHKWSYKL